MSVLSAKHLTERNNAVLRSPCPRTGRGQPELSMPLAFAERESCSERG